MTYIYIYIYIYIYTLYLKYIIYRRFGGVSQSLVDPHYREIDFGFVLRLRCVCACVRAKLRERDDSSLARADPMGFVGGPAVRPAVRPVPGPAVLSGLLASLAGLAGLAGLAWLACGTPLLPVAFRCLPCAFPLLIFANLCVWTTGAVGPAAVCLFVWTTSAVGPAAVCLLDRVG